MASRSKLLNFWRVKGIIKAIKYMPNLEKTAYKIAFYGLLAIALIETFILGYFIGYK